MVQTVTPVTILRPWPELGLNFPFFKNAICQISEGSALTWALLGLGWKLSHSVKYLKAEDKPRPGWYHTWAEGERGPGQCDPPFSQG